MSKALALAQSVRDDKLRSRTLLNIALDLAIDSFPEGQTGIEPFRRVKNEFTPEEAAIAKVVAEAIRSN